jgi:predicted amidophosphoribosyltransferase
VSNPAERYWAMKNAALLSAKEPYTCPECQKPTPEEGMCDDCLEKLAYSDWQYWNDAGSNR